MTVVGALCVQAHRARAVHGGLQPYWRRGVYWLDRHVSGLPPPETLSGSALNHHGGGGSVYKKVAHGPQVYITGWKPVGLLTHDTP